MCSIVWRNTIASRGPQNSRRGRARSGGSGACSAAGRARGRPGWRPRRRPSAAGPRGRRSRSPRRTPGRRRSGRHAVGDPLVDRQVAPVPVVLVGHVGQRALARSARAAARPPAGPAGRESWRGSGSAGGLPFRPHARLSLGDSRAHQGREHPLSRRGGESRTTPSGASTSARSGRTRRARSSSRPSGRARAAFGDALEIGAGTGYFGLNLMQEGTIERLTATDISPGMLDSLSASASALGDVEHVGDRGRVAAVRRRELRPRAGPRGAPPHPGPRPRFLRVPPRPAAGRHGRLLRRAVPIRRPHRDGPQARGHADGARSGGRDARARARTATYDRAQNDGHELEPEVDVHAFDPGRARPLARTRRA